ncbi:MAG: ferrous iron transporter B [Senegalimassilia anaerobia]|uniref:ferrous iron transporter B n=1 Tax=Senegalimassilia anaerobia TaxID=1473216 RepID=UPI002E799A7F|nr:ferrous iron transporter B [Senegalimassilia anaerobia]MEE0304429.1 ferrous iron transporter B [Senegalimassilia anaerobia]
MGICIALAGNPNCGKTTMFNDLTGANQYVGNWPGVTVEKKEGKYTRDKDVTITDLPGIYSLSPYSPEEIVARDYLLEGGPDAVINLVDATNLERNLYLTSQILNLGVPVVIALNMMDLVEKNGDKIDVDGLSRELGCPIVPTSALKGRGMEDVVKAAIDAARTKKAPALQMKFDAAVEEALVKIEGVLGDKVAPNAARWYAIKLFEAEDKTIADLKLSQADLDAISAIRTSIEDKLDDDAESIITAERYDAISHVVDKTVKRTRTGLTTSQKIDRVVTNRWLGLPIFIVIMFFVYWLAVSVGGGVVTDWANDGISGDGWLYTGNAAFDEATEEYEDAHSQVVTYVENILGEDEESELPSDASQEVLDALAAEEPEAPEDDADADAVAEYEDAMAEYEEAQAIVADFDEQAQASHAVASMEVEDEGGNVEEQTITFADYQKALEVEEPDPSDGTWGLWIPGLGAIIADAMEAADVAPWLQSLVNDGIVSGVGAVIGFIPQMVILFLLLGILELCGYMSRVAFIMDRIFRKFGLSGKSFIPMLIASGCGVPAVMSTKTIENEMDRRMTIMTTTMIPCGAKMPIIALVFGALASGDSSATWYVAPMFYFLGVIAIILSGIMLKKTKLFAGEATPFVMELPEYHMPTVKSILLSMWERVKGYIIKAGTIIFLSTIVIWFLMNFGDAGEGFGLLDPDAPDYMEHSLMAGLGNLLAWIFAPLGFDNWQATATAVTGLVAKENVVATVGIITQLADYGEADPQLWFGFLQMLGGSTAAVVAFCAFNLLCAPCFAAMGTIRQQQNSPKWFWITIGYLCGFAWCVGTMLYQFVGLATGEVEFNVFTVVAIVIAAVMLFQIFRPMPKRGEKQEK